MKGDCKCEDRVALHQRHCTWVRRAAHVESSLPSFPHSQTTLHVLHGHTESQLYLDLNS